MRAGFVDISLALLADFLHFPPDWSIDGCYFDPQTGRLKLLVNGSDFPEMGLPPDNEIKTCRLLYTKHPKFTIEVKEL